MRNAELMGHRRGIQAGAGAGRRFCNSALRIPHSASMAIGISLALQSPDPWPILDRASKTYQTVTSLSATFVQMITNPDIVTPGTTRGRQIAIPPSRQARRDAAPRVVLIVAVA